MTHGPRWAAGTGLIAPERQAKWHVCWYGETEDDGWVQHKGPACSLAEAQRRMGWGKGHYPQLVYWLEHS